MWESGDEAKRNLIEAIIGQMFYFVKQISRLAGFGRATLPLSEPLGSITLFGLSIPAFPSGNRKLRVC
jgi:hypothetical protein